MRFPEKSGRWLAVLLLAALPAAAAPEGARSELAARLQATLPEVKAADYSLGYALALGCAFVWSTYSVLSRRFGETPTDAIAAFCAASALLSLFCHLMFERTVWPASGTAWLAVVALGLGPAGAAFYLWDHAVKRSDIRALGACSYATPILSTALLIVCGFAAPTWALLLAALLVAGGAALASRDLWKR